MTVETVYLRARELDAGDKCLQGNIQIAHILHNARMMNMESQLIDEQCRRNCAFDGRANVQPQFKGAASGSLQSPAAKLLPLASSASALSSVLEGEVSTLRALRPNTCKPPTAGQERMRQPGVPRQSPGRVLTECPAIQAAGQFTECQRLACSNPWNQNEWLFALGPTRARRSTPPRQLRLVHLRHPSSCVSSGTHTISPALEEMPCNDVYSATPTLPVQTRRLRGPREPRPPPFDLVHTFYWARRLARAPSSPCTGVLRQSTLLLPGASWICAGLPATGCTVYNETPRGCPATLDPRRGASADRSVQASTRPGGASSDGSLPSTRMRGFASFFPARQSAAGRGNLDAAHVHVSPIALRVKDFWLSTSVAHHDACSTRRFDPHPLSRFFSSLARATVLAYPWRCYGSRRVCYRCAVLRTCTRPKGLARTTIPAPWNLAAKNRGKDEAAKGSRPPLNCFHLRRVLFSTA
ncbi:hypothetical protein FB451DRAFT_1164994 [Mycena latifolia]|nr:hypothetical protein FB451DRAFT_1164994 [Mycena latifolia]